jgi:hypothetical protein
MEGEDLIDIISDAQRDRPVKAVQSQRCTGIRAS